MVKSGGVSGHSHAGEQEQAGARKRGRKRRLSPRLHITLPPEVYQKAKERWPNVSRVVASLLEVALAEDLTVEEVVTAVTLLRRGVLVAGERRGSLARQGGGLVIPRSRVQIPVPAPPRFYTPFAKVLWWFRAPP